MAKRKYGLEKRAPRKFTPEILAWFDGCCEPVNPGGTASFGAVAIDAGSKVRLWECSRIFYPEKGREKETSNNVAEYSGFLAILEWLASEGLSHRRVLVHGDSKLVIEQCFGTWQIHGGHYAPLAAAAREKLRAFPNLYGKWIPRDENDIADELSKAELIKAGVEFRIQPNE